MDSEKALLVAVERAVRVRADRPELLVNGSPVIWPRVASVMLALTGDEGYGGAQASDVARNRHARFRTGKTAEQLDAIAASVDPSCYREVVDALFASGKAPEAVPAIPGVNAERAEDEEEEKGRQLTPTQRRKAMILSDPSDEILEMIADADERIEQAEAKARTFERLYKQAKARSAFVRTAIDALRDTVTALEPLPWDKEAIPAIHMTKEQEAVLILSDIHIGDEIKTDTMGAINEYNFDIFKEKAKRLFAGVKESLEMLREFGPCRKLNIFGLGDWVTGTNIFPGQAHHVEFGAMKQAIYGADEMALLYQELLHLPGIEVVEAEHVPGNHGRPGRKGADPFEDNWDLVLYEFHRLRLQRETRIKYRWHESWWMKPRIMGWDFLCAHGDEVKGHAGIPNYGFRRWSYKWREMLDSIGQRYDYGIIGHHHIEIEERNLVISGAWPGASFFSAKELQMAGPATQMLYSVTEEHGITWRRRLPLDPPRHPNWSNQQSA